MPQREYTIEMIQGTTVMEQMRSLIKIVVDFMNSVQQDSVQEEREQRIAQDELLTQMIEQEQIQRQESDNEIRQILSQKQDTLIQGEGIIIQDNVISQTGTLDIDSEMSDTSENAVMNKVIKAYVDSHSSDDCLKLESTILQTVVSPIEIRGINGGFRVYYTDGNDIESNFAVLPGQIQLRSYDDDTTNKQEISMMARNVHYQSEISVNASNINVSAPNIVVTSNNFYIPDSAKGDQSQKAVNGRRLMQELADIDSDFDVSLPITKTTDPETERTIIGCNVASAVDDSDLPVQSAQVQEGFRVTGERIATLDQNKAEKFNQVFPLRRVNDGLELYVSNTVEDEDTNPVSSAQVYITTLNLYNNLMDEIGQRQPAFGVLSPLEMTSEGFIKLQTDTTPIQNSAKAFTSGGAYTMQQDILSDMTVLSNQINNKLDKQNPSGTGKLLLSQTHNPCQFKGTKSLAEFTGSWFHTINFEDANSERVQDIIIKKVSDNTTQVYIRWLNNGVLMEKKISD